MRHVFYSFVFLVLFQQFCIHSATLPEKLPADTQVIICVDYVNLSKKPLIREFKKIHADTYRTLKQHLKNGVGFDLEKTKEIWLAGPDFNNLFLVVKGDFDTSKVAAAVVINTELKMVERKGCRLAVMLPENGVPNVNMAAIIDDKTIVFGKPGQVDHYLNSLSGKEKDLKSSTERKIRKKFKSCSHIQGLLNLKPNTNDPGLNGLLQNLNYGLVKIKLEKDLSGSLTMEAKNSQKAKGIKLVLHGLLFNALNQPGRTSIENAIRKDLAANLSVQVKGKTVVVRSKIGEESLAKVINMQAIQVPEFNPGKK